jgi:hypothetical protein
MIIKNRIASRYPLLDAEASGLMKGSFPVDIAWSLYGEVKSVLIKPAPTWNENKWDAVAQSIHGITIPYLRRHGKDVRQAARIMNDDLRGMTAYCDSPARDAQWIDMVFTAAGVRREFEIASIGHLLGSLGVTSTDAYESFDASRESHPPDGVARDGVIHLQAVFDHLQVQGVIHP